MLPSLPISCLSFPLFSQCSFRHVASFRLPNPSWCLTSLLFAHSFTSSSSFPSSRPFVDHLLFSLTSITSLLFLFFFITSFHSSRLTLMIIYLSLLFALPSSVSLIGFHLSSLSCITLSPSPLRGSLLPPLRQRLKQMDHACKLTRLVYRSVEALIDAPCKQTSKYVKKKRLVY